MKMKKLCLEFFFEVALKFFGKFFCIFNLSLVLRDQLKRNFSDDGI